MTYSFEIDGVKVGGNSPCYVIAEMSANHGGSIDEALRMIHAAKDMRADAVKLQTYRADTITLNCNNTDFRLPTKNPWEKFQTLYSLYDRAHTPWEWHEELFKEARRIGITIFSSPFDHTSVELLESLNTPAYKIASPEITDIPLIARVAKTGKPVIVSTGLAELEDIALAVETLRKNGCEDLAILRCTTAYPAQPSDSNLALLPDMAKRFKCVVGLSDHTLGQAVPIASIHYGAKIIEKHFVLNHTDSVDGFFSLDTKGFHDLVTNIHMSEEAIGIVDYAIPESAKANFFARRSIYISANVRKGDTITTNNVKCVRPGYGLHPKYFDNILGKKFAQDGKLGDRLTLSAIDGINDSNDTKTSS